VRKAISPIIATVILIAVTLAIGVAIAAWIMGIWGGMGGTESLKILPNSTLTVDRMIKLPKINYQERRE
jgi:flagellin-like protein